MSHREAPVADIMLQNCEPHVFRVALLLLEWQAIDHCAIQNCLTGGLQSNGNPQSILVRVWLQPYRRKSGKMIGFSRWPQRLKACPFDKLRAGSERSRRGEVNLIRSAARLNRLRKKSRKPTALW